MDAKDKSLFDEMVTSKVVLKAGLVEIPLGAMREYHEAVGLKDNQSAAVPIVLSCLSDTSCRFGYGDGSSGDAIPPQLCDVSFYDAKANRLDSISAGINSGLFVAINRDFYEDGFSIINPIVVDQKGRVYITSWYSDDIFSKFYFDLSLDEGGCRFVAMDDGSEVCAWLKNDIVYVSYPVTLGIVS